MPICKEWMIYILENNLVDMPLYSNGKLLGFISPIEAAVKFEVGESTIRSWIKIGMLNSITIGNNTFIPAWIDSPIKKGVE